MSGSGDIKIGHFGKLLEIRVFTLPEKGGRSEDGLGELVEVCGVGDVGFDGKNTPRKVKVKVNG